MMELVHQIHVTLNHGGPVVWLILVLSVLLYSRCFSLVLHLHAVRRTLRADAIEPGGSLAHLHAVEEDLGAMFERQRSVIAAMIAAAPLLGLLGTVTGMIRTFSHLADGTGGPLMGGLADGISEALIATAAGLSVAIPAVLMLYAAHRQLQQAIHTVADLERRALEAH